MTQTGTDSRPLRVAIVGSGPSGFYAAEALFGADVVAHVDMYESLPTPFGLVRYGVAPDHHKIKNVIKRYERVAEDERFSFFGNVAVGRDVSVEELRGFYDAIVFACGAQTDRRLGIPGEDLPGSYTATEFVAWYNGHPEYADRTFDLSNEVAVVIGQGNVAVDVARILCKTTDELKTTDITQYALDALAQSQVREVHMIGRRGPAQCAFTPPEIKEFGELAECDPVVDPAQLELSETSKKDLELTREARKNYETLRAYAARPAGTKPRKFVVDFYRSPKELTGNGRVEKVVLERNELVGEPGRQKARGTGELSELACGAFFRSVGYRGVPITGVPFRDDWGVFPNSDGRITDSPDGDVVPGLYAVGWIKRGPSGIIGTNKPDSIATIKALLEDVGELTPCAEPSREAPLGFLRDRGVRVVTYDHWKKIDAAEVKRGEAAGKPREKFVTVEDMLAAAGL